jgi:exoribonuclease R
LTPQKKIECYRQLARKRKIRYEKAWEERDGAAAHAVMAGQHILSLNQKLNSKRDKAGKGRLDHIEARVITTGEGRAEAAKQRKAREEKDTKAAQRKTEKEDEAAAVRARRLALGASGITFCELKGTLKSQKV